MKILITGSDGFIAKNLKMRLSENKIFQIICFSRSNDSSQLASLVKNVDFIFHLGGVNRPDDEKEFAADNIEFTRQLSCAVADVAKSTGKKIAVVFASSVQATQATPYGRSKYNAERILRDVEADYGIPVYIFRLSNVFGKWCKPNYNSVVATFCYNIARDLPIKIFDSEAAIPLVYVDDVIETFIQLIEGRAPMGQKDGFFSIEKQYSLTVGELASQIRVFKESRDTLITDRVGKGLMRALYSTYLSYLPPSSFSYSIPAHRDARGVFVEMLKTPDCGQFSFFTALPGITRGGHYHHTKTEKFLVIKGFARFRFRHMDSGEEFEIVSSGDEPEIVETAPGWTHDITNTGLEEMIVMLWANEIFDPARPDTFACPFETL